MEYALGDYRYVFTSMHNKRTMTIWRKDIPIIYDLLQKSRHKHANAGPKLIEHTLPETEIAPARKLPQKETHLPTMIFFVLS